MKALIKWYQSPVGGAIGMGLIWAIGWGICVGGLFEAFIDPYGEILDMWPQTVAVPGFLGGIIFFTLLRIAKGRHRLDKLSLPLSGAWGAVSGLLLGLVAITMGYMEGLFQSFGLYMVIILGSMIMLSAIAAFVTVVLFKYGVREENGSGATQTNH